ncbi:MAG: hypothetical protein E4H00_08975, partial [Myxococcales bacterium]
ALLASAWGCSKAEREQPRPPIVLISIDTLRPDHLEIYGYTRKTAPNIARLAEDSIVFDRAFSTAAKTTPAHASVFTGKYPHNHGLRVLGEELADENSTAAEILSRHGYESSAYVSSTVMIDRLSRLGQGFALWDDHLPAREMNRDNFERKATGTVRAALETWPRTPAPAFLFVHLVDPHGPYVPPPPFRLRFQDRKGEILDPSMVPDFQKLSGAVVVGDYIDSYDAEIAYTDSEVGTLLAEITKRDLYDAALIIVTADHGESFGEDGYYFRHGKTLHEVSTRVPLVVKPPGGRRAGVSSIWGGTVSLVDLLPTMLDYAEVASPDDLDGLSLRPILEGATEIDERFVFSERPAAGGGHWAVHGEHGSVVIADCTPGTHDCSDTYLARADSGRLIEIGEQTATRVRLRNMLDAFVAKVQTHHVPFTVTIRYRPGDKDFVKRFVIDHNMKWESYTDEDLKFLGALGYVDD